LPFSERALERLRVGFAAAVDGLQDLVVDFLVDVLEDDDSLFVLERDLERLLWAAEAFVVDDWEEGTFRSVLDLVEDDFFGTLDLVRLDTGGVEPASLLAADEERERLRPEEADFDEALDDGE
jgi:hypothetical protein